MDALKPSFSNTLSTFRDCGCDAMKKHTKAKDVVSSMKKFNEFSACQVSATFKCEMSDEIVRNDVNFEHSDAVKNILLGGSPATVGMKFIKQFGQADFDKKTLARVMSLSCC